MKISHRALSVKPSATLAITAKAKEMRAQGIDVLTMSAGEPDFSTPANIQQAAIKAIEAGTSKYTPVPGIPSLRDAIAQRSSELYGLSFERQNVLVSNGGKQVLFNAANALLDPGDEAVFGAPYWVSYPDMIRFAGATPVTAFADQAKGFLPKADDFEAVLTDRTRLLIVNSPANPTGATYTPGELEDIAALIRSHPNLVVISDDIYEALVYDDDFVGLARVAPDLQDRMLIVGGVSKSYAMTGWRIGYGVGPTELIGAMSRIQGASTSGAGCISQPAALEALVGSQDEVDKMRTVFKARRDRIVEGLNAIPGISCLNPGGAFYVFPCIKDLFNDTIQGSAALCSYLLEEVHLAAVPGVAFGADDYLRLSFACGDETIDNALKRLHQAAKALQA